MSSIYGCGYNSFSKLTDLQALGTVTAVSEDESKKNQQAASGSKTLGNKIMHPIMLFGLDKRDHLQNLFFTWAGIAATLLRDNGSFTSYVTGFKGEKEDVSAPQIFSSCAVVAATDSDVLLGSPTVESPSMVLKESIANVQIIDKIQDDTSLQKVCGGHKDFFAVYDGISFGTLNINKLENVDDKDIDHCKEKLRVHLQLHHIDSGIRIQTLSCGKEHALLLSEHGSVYSYGLGSRGQLGHDSVEPESSPKLVEMLEGVPMTSVCAGGWHSASVSEIGDLYTWGWNESGQLGLSAPSQRVKSKSKASADEEVGIQLEPCYVKLSDDFIVSAVACGSRHTVLLAGDGKVFTCGWNAYGQLGLGHSESQDKFIEVTSLKGKCDRIFAGQWNSIFVMSEETK